MRKARESDHYLGYGPCDGLGPGGECTECYYLTLHEEADRKYVLWLAGESRFMIWVRGLLNV